MVKSDGDSSLALGMTRRGGGVVEKKWRFAEIYRRKPKIEFANRHFFPTHTK